MVTNHANTFIAFILVGNNLTNIALILVMFRVWKQLAVYTPEPETFMWVANLVGTTTWILIAGEILPKLVAVRRAVAWVKVSAFPLVVVWWLLYPLTFALSRLFKQLGKKFSPSREETLLWLEEVLTQLAPGKELTEKELEILRNLIRFSDIPVKHIMLSRTDMPALPQTATPEEVIQFVKKHRISHIPVYKGDSLDEILGVLKVKDFLLATFRGEYPRDWHKRFVTQPLFVPEYTKLPQLLELFRQKREVMALVVDEYGGVSGMVALEDILEEIIGEIYGEFDTQTPDIQKISDTIWRVKGSASLHVLVEELGLPVNYFADLEGVDTVAGLILHHTHLVPPAGTTIRYKDLIFTVEFRTPQRILQVRVKKDASIEA